MYKDSPRYKKQDFRKAEVQNSENRKSRISIIENQERNRYGNKQKILEAKWLRNEFGKDYEEYSKSKQSNTMG